ncbi:MAG TPA: nuclear transport factor 2 family protein [Chloroflexota bacterium]|jgi:ketosteroid isomerase-like protein|nr:nuclear transport factor 2 family protein [Chloroflexota bacterium]
MTTHDYDQIVRAVQLYVEGFGSGDVAKLKEAFHEDAWMFFVDRDGRFVNCPLTDEVFEGWSRQKREKIGLRVISVAQMGDVAAVALAFGDEWMDFHSLVRVDGAWKITNKTASHRSRE